MISEELAETEVFRVLVEQFRSECEAHRLSIIERNTREEERRRRKPINSKLNYIHQGLRLDYDAEFGDYVRNAMKWGCAGEGDFEFLLEQLGRWAKNIIPQHCKKGRPDVAFAIAKGALTGLNDFLEREDVKKHVSDKKARSKFGKIFKTYVEGLNSATIQWNNEDKRIEANTLLTSASKYLTKIGVKASDIQTFKIATKFTGAPLTIKREPNRYEAREIDYQNYLRRQQEKLARQNESERLAIVKLNPLYETKAGNGRNDFEGALISVNLCLSVKREIKDLLSEDNSYQATMSFLQCVKTLQKHFIKYHHWEYFDDYYQPDYDCRDIYKIIKQHLDIKPNEEAQALLLKGAAELREMEAYQEYGIPSCLNSIK